MTSSSARSRSSSRSTRSRRSTDGQESPHAHQAPDPRRPGQPRAAGRPALGQHGVNIMEFCKAFNAQTAARERPHHPGRDHGLRGPLVQLHHEDAAGRGADQGGAAARARAPASRTARRSAGSRRDQVRQIAETKMPDLNARDVEAGDARSSPARHARMGVEVAER